MKICGLAAFLTAMPMDVLTGDGRGFIADPDHFQGWEIVVLFGVVFIYWGVLEFNFGVVVFLPILLATLFTLGAPFVDFSPGTDQEPSPRKQPPGRRNWRRIFLAIGAMSVFATAILFALWPDGHWDSKGHFFGSYLWLGGASAVVIGAAMQAFHALGDP